MLRAQALPPQANGCTEISSYYRARGVCGLFHIRLEARGVDISSGVAYGWGAADSPLFTPLLMRCPMTTKTIRDARRNDELMDALAEHADEIVAARQALAVANFEVKRANNLHAEAFRMKLGYETLKGYNADIVAACAKRDEAFARFQRTQINGGV